MGIGIAESEIGLRTAESDLSLRTANVRWGCEQQETEIEKLTTAKLDGVTHTTAN